MNFKKLSIVLVIFFSLIVCVGAVSAADGANTTDVTDNTQETVTETPTTAQATDEQVEEVAPSNKVITDTDTDGVIAEKGKTAYLKVKVENERTDRPLKNLKLNIKVFTKSKSKIYTVKTNSYGIAKFNTKVLSKGDHKIVITSADSKYKVYKKTSAFIGKKHVTTMKLNTQKVLSNKDKIKVYSRYDDDDIEVKMKVIKGKSVAKTKISKAKFYLKNKRTGQVIVKTDKAEFDDGKWQNPDEDYSYYRYTLVKVKIWYLTV